MRQRGRNAGAAQVSLDPNIYARATQLTVGHRVLHDARSFTAGFGPTSVRSGRIGIDDHDRVEVLCADGGCQEAGDAFIVERNVSLAVEHSEHPSPRASSRSPSSTNDGLSTQARSRSLLPEESKVFQRSLMRREQPAREIPSQQLGEKGGHELQYETDVPGEVDRRST